MRDHHNWSGRWRASSFVSQARLALCIPNASLGAKSLDNSRSGLLHSDLAMVRYGRREAHRAPMLARVAAAVITDELTPDEIARLYQDAAQMIESLRKLVDVQNDLLGDEPAAGNA